MLPKRMIEGFDRIRLRNLLLLFFLALAAPTAILIWQAYTQLKWEAFHQYRVVAEELTQRIDARLNDMVEVADARTFSDYTFFVVSGDPSAKFLQRSPLSAYPVIAHWPGVLGYFQVDADGDFSTPVLPPQGTVADSLGIGEDEYTSRLRLAQELQVVLADNRLVRSRPGIGADRENVSALQAPSTILEEEKGTVTTGGLVASESADKDAVDRLDAKPVDQSVFSDANYSQQIFDQLNQPGRAGGFESGRAGAPESDDAMGEARQAEPRANAVGKVSGLKLDAELQKKSEALERDAPSEMDNADGSVLAPGRRKRKEQSALPESVSVADSEVIANVTGPSDLRISTFESEIDPFEFSLLDSGHFVLFRQVWRDGERYIQGILLDQETFIQDTVGTSFMGTALADMTSLIVAYQDDVIHTLSGRDGQSYPDVAEGLDGSLLYRNRLTAPMNSLELIFSIKRLPPGPGASVLGWVTLVLAIVLVGGFSGLYRMGLSQINLARQQQDFVSAVSHELKSPLTSIRMYGEMLKEGWADEDKRQSYYEFIHDESERLSRLISNVLQLASITRNEPQLDQQKITVGELMINIESKISSQIKRAGFELKFNKVEDADSLTINIDEDCFAQMIINLVDNAIKFSGNAEIKTIEITSQRLNDNRVQFSVRDYGPGIAKDQMKKIFELFYRSESELTRETVGTGIGLAIVHQLAKAMGGEVDMVNADPGAEFRFWFSLAEQDQ
jgi:signal transduction histidine kinase